MPIRRYVEVGVFTSDAQSAMNKVFEAAVWTLGIGRDKIKREAVAKFIIGLAQEDADLDAATLHRKTVAALGGPVNGGEPENQPELIGGRGVLASCRSAVGGHLRCER